MKIQHGIFIYTRLYEMKNILTSKIFYKICIISVIVFSLGYGLYSRILISNSFINFGVDQVRDLEVYDGMKQGIMPGLGPIAPMQDSYFYLPPLYFYVMAPAHFLFPSVNSSLIATAIISFLSIPLFSFLVYLNLPAKNKTLRLTLSLLGGLWWSIFPPDIVNAHFATNTGILYFFLFLYLILIRIFEKINKLNSKMQILFWFCFGVISTILINLHTTALAIILPNTAILVLEYLLKSTNKKKFLHVAIFALITLALMLPYIRYETANNFENTSYMLSFVSNASTSASLSFFDRIFRIVQNYFSMMNRGFFTLEAYWPLATLLGTFSFVFFTKKRKANIILKNLFRIFILYSILIFFYSGHFNLRYQILILIVPMIGALLGLYDLITTKTKLKFVFLPILLFLVLGSIVTSVKYSNSYVQRSIGNKRLMNANDIVRISDSLLSDSSICIAGQDLERGADYILNTKLQKNVTILQDCVDSDYIIYPLFEPVVLYDYSTLKNSFDLKEEGLLEIEKTGSYILYKKTMD
jgi:hypothetical protein